VKKASLLFVILGTVSSLRGQAQNAAAPTRVGIIHIQNAIMATRDGQKAAGDLNAKIEPKRKELESRQNAIAALQQELNKGSNTMAEEKRLQMTREIDQKTKSLTRASEDAQAELEQDQNRILNELGQRVMVVIEKYARENGYSLILDVSSQQTPVLYAANGTDLTKDIVELYDKNAPPPAPATAKPVVPLPSAAKPPALPPATKKQPGTVK